MSKDRQDIDVIDNGNASTIHDSDHGRPWSHSNPHAHDENGEHGKPRDLNNNERYAYESFKTENSDGSDK